MRTQPVSPLALHGLACAYTYLSPCLIWLRRKCSPLSPVVIRPWPYLQRGAATTAPFFTPLYKKVPTLSAQIFCVNISVSTLRISASPSLASPFNCPAYLPIFHHGQAQSPSPGRNRAVSLSNPRSLSLKSPPITDSLAFQRAQGMG